MRNAPPAIRANSVEYLKQTGPAPFRYILIGILVYSVVNLLLHNLILAVLDISIPDSHAYSYEIMFAPHWILFFLAASYLSWPVSLDAKGDEKLKKGRSATVGHNGPEVFNASGPEKSDGPFNASAPGRSDGRAGAMVGPADSDETSRGHSKMGAALTAEMGNPLDSGMGNALDSDTRNAVRAHFSTDQRPSLMKRIVSGGFAFALGITAVLSVVLGAFALIFEVYFYLFVALMFASVTYVNYRYRKKQCWYHLLEISIGRTVQIRYFEGDTLIERQYSKETVRSEWKEEVIRGNSIFSLQIFVFEELPLMDEARRQGHTQRGGSKSDLISGDITGGKKEEILLRQHVNAYWPYEELDAIHGLLRP